MPPRDRRSAARMPIAARRAARCESSRASSLAPLRPGRNERRSCRELEQARFQPRRGAAEEVRRAALLSFGDEGGDRTEEGGDLPGRAGGQVSGQHARVVVPESEDAAIFAAHAEESAQVATQLSRRGGAGEEDAPRVLPAAGEELVEGGAA